MQREPIDRVLVPTYRFLQQDSASGTVLIVAVVIALVWANFGGDSYINLLHTEFTVGFPGWSLTKSIHHWINDGLMTVFFFSIGLEIKQEILTGELSTVKKATLPMVAAIGGMVVPALVFVLLTYGKPGSHGWGIPMATDIAFALGLLSFISRQVPTSLKVFLTALAVVDDLGAVLVIALFYTDGIVVSELGIAVLFMGAMFLANYLGFRRSWVYLTIGTLGLWYAVLLSGVHATIAGVLAAIAIPVRTRISEQDFTQQMQKLINRFTKSPVGAGNFLSSEQTHIIDKMDSLTERAQTPLQRFEHQLAPLISFVIMPVFALANAGVVIEGNLLDILTQPVCYGIIAGLLIGKFVGIFSFSWLTVSLGGGQLPKKSNWSQLAGISVFGGIGFTMSLFIAELAFTDSVLLRDAKIGILIASVIASIGALTYFKVFLRNRQPTEKKHLA